MLLSQSSCCSSSFQLPVAAAWPSCYWHFKGWQTVHTKAFFTCLALCSCIILCDHIARTDRRSNATSWHGGLGIWAHARNSYLAVQQDQFTAQESSYKEQLWGPGTEESLRKRHYSGAPSTGSGEWDRAWSVTFSMAAESMSGLWEV